MRSKRHPGNVVSLSERREARVIEDAPAAACFMLGGAELEAIYRGNLEAIRQGPEAEARRRAEMEKRRAERRGDGGAK